MYVYLHRKRDRRGILNNEDREGVDVEILAEIVK